MFRLALQPRTRLPLAASAARWASTSSSSQVAPRARAQKPQYRQTTFEGAGKVKQGEEWVSEGVRKARAKSVKDRNVWESYLVLTPKSRLFISLGLGAFGLVGLYAGDALVPEEGTEKREGFEKWKSAATDKVAVS